jgi:hypothetical protein
LLAAHATFAVTVNSVRGGPLRNPADAITIAERARTLGLISTVGILHDGSGHVRPLAPDQVSIYERILAHEQSLFSFAQYDRFQRNIALGLPNDWHCRAGSRFLYVCEEGLVHYCSQQRGHPAIPLEHYTREHLKQEGSHLKPCAPYCTVSCVHQAAMLDAFREDPRGTLAGMIERRRQHNPAYRPPLVLKALTWAFLDGCSRRALSKLALYFLRARS